MRSQSRWFGVLASVAVLAVGCAVETDDGVVLGTAVTTPDSDPSGTQSATTAPAVDVEPAPAQTAAASTMATLEQSPATLPQGTVAAEGGCPAVSAILGARSNTIIDATCSFVEALGVTMLVDFDGDELSELTGVCAFQGTGFLEPSAPVGGASTDGSRLDFSVDSQTFEACTVSAMWSANPPSDAPTVLADLGEALLTDSESLVASVATATEPPFPLPPGAPRESWYSFDGSTFIEEIAAADIQGYCDSLAQAGQLEPPPPDISAIFAEGSDEPPPVCLGVSQGWLIFVSVEFADSGSVVALPVDSLRGML